MARSPTTARTLRRVPAPTSHRDAPLLVVFSGLPGTGKSTLAAHAAQILHAPLFTKDVLEAALTRSGITREMGSGYAGYEQLTVLAEAQLGLGLSVVLDSVAPYRRLRDAWRTLADRTGAAFRAIECVATDEAIHRSRMDGRQRGIAGWPELTWDEVEAVRSRYEAWQEERLVLDAARPLAENLAALERYLELDR